MTRKKTPDILADLLGTNPNSSGENDSKKLNQQNSEDDKQQAVSLSKQQSSSEVAVPPTDQQLSPSEENESKIKVTVYLSEETIDLLEEAQRTLRRLARSQGKAVAKSATSKSALVEEALRHVCNDIESNGPKSHLACKML